jgi:glycosyltransferase involved in cell wall biosynthesis
MSATSQAVEPTIQKEKTLCLTMIVLNESKIIRTCLESIADYLDYWVIHDTGSTDGTPEIIEEFFAERGISGEIHHTPWKDFGYNRTQGLLTSRGKADYCILLDADFIAHVHDKNFKKKLSSPGYLLRYKGGLDYRQILLIEAKHNWAYYGVTHEYIDTRPQLPVEITEMLTIEHTGEGSNRSEKFLRDVNLLTRGLKEEPDNARYWFYLAQSYKDWGKYDEAIEAYKKRVAFPAWDEEVFYSYYQIAMSKKRRGDDFYDYLGDYLKAWKARPSRIEPLYQVLDDCAHDPKLADIGYQIGMLNSHLTYPSFDLLFIEKPLYEWMYLDMLSTAAHTAGKYKEALELTERLIQENRFPDGQKQRFMTNLQLLRQKVESSGQSVLPVNPYRFRRINVTNKTNRVAVIIANYNMRERTDNLVNTIYRRSSWPTDIIVVDNGSDQVAPSRFTAVNLTKNVQTTHAWFAGLNYADSLEVLEGFKYLSYVFVITSGELMDQVNDPIKSLAEVLVQNQEAVGVHPALTIDSTTHWKQLIYQHPPQLRQTNMIDNIFSMYRADWFNSIGRFEKTMTYAWGIDIETSYLARASGKKLFVHDGVLIRKISNIGYKLGRMGMSSRDRFENASKQMNAYMVGKYGENYGQVLDSNCFPERVSNLQPPEEQLEGLYRLMMNFEKMEGPHQQLIEFLYRTHHRYFSLQQPRVLEIGMTRENYPHMNSTEKLWQICQVYGYQFTSVDIDPLVVDANRKRLGSHSKLNLVCQKGEDYCKSLQGPVHFVYLDAFDFVTKPDHEDVSRVARYQELLGQKITNQNSARMHLDCCREIISKMAVGGIICLAEPKYKAKTAIPFLLDHGFNIIRETEKSILLQKTSQRPVTDRSLTSTPHSGQISKPLETSNSVGDKKALNQSELKQNYVVTLLGYKNSRPRHTNWYPWFRFQDVFSTLGYQVEWVELDELKERRHHMRRRLFICWNEPTSIELIQSGLVRKDDIIFQKLTSLGKGMNDVNWGTDPYKWCKEWHWPLYQTVEKLYDQGYNIYGFGCKTRSEPFPEKNRIVKKLEEAGRLFWINWGTTMYNYDKLRKMKPVMEGFNHSIGFVGSKWGVVGRGNIDQWDKYMQPLVDKYPDSCSLHGSGLGSMPENGRAGEILRESKLCPIIHAPSWVAEEGIQDRFWSVFASGRFGVCDNPGVYEFFDKDEVVVETDPEKYVERSIYFLEHPEEQLPYIEKVQKKIREKYNWYVRWAEILNQVLPSEYQKLNDGDEHVDRITKMLDVTAPFL